MPVDATWRLQSNSGQVTTSATPWTITPSLPNPTQDGSTLLLIIGTASAGSVNGPGGQGYDPPWFAELGSGTGMYWWRRDNQPAGETSWAINVTPTAARYIWHVQEWSGLSTVANPDAASLLNGSPSYSPSFQTGAQAPHLAGNVGFTLTPDVTDYAALAVVKAGSDASGVFPAAWSWPAGWSQVDAIQAGDGSHTTGATTTDFMVAIAEAYPQAASALDPSLTWDTTGGGSYTNRSTVWGGACYQPAAPAPFGGVLTG